VPVVIDDVLTTLCRGGYYATRLQVGREEAGQFVLEVAQSLGEVFLPTDCDPDEPIIRTTPARTRRAAPFDRPEAIGWHGDFATYEDRPELSIVYITRPDPRGGNFGAWRLASVARVISALRATAEGRTAFDLLSQEKFPFSYAEEEPPRWFPVLEPRPEGNIGLRFYLPSIRRGCLSAYGEIPPHLVSALQAVERAADEVAEVVPTQEGSLLITNNWFALHDRVRQTISRTRENREALLCFVAQQHSALRENR
jgi:hypothetical protein